MYIITEKKVAVEGKEYTVYGIKYSDEYFVEDISSDRAAVEGLASDCNKYTLDPVQLYDVIEDFLALI